MRYSARSLSALRTTTVLVFLTVMLVVLGVLFVKFGGNLPGLTNNGYKVNAQFTDIQNLVTNSDVDMAGVAIGKVEGVSHTDGHEVVTMSLHHNTPIHQGATVQIRAKTMLNETYVQITDGAGSAMKSGSTLPLGSVTSETTINDVLNALNPDVRTKTAALIDELQAATTGQGGNLNQILGGLGDIGRNGQTVFDILANQQGDLQQMVKQTATLLAVLDEGQGQIAQLVTSAQQVNQTTSAAQSAVAASIQGFPQLMQAVQSSSSSVTDISDALIPVSQDFQAAAPVLNHDLEVLPGVTTDLRNLNPTMLATLQAAPATLVPIQTTATDLDQANPSLAYTLSDFDPMVAYLAPYNADISSFIENFGAAADHTCGLGCPNYTVSEPLIKADNLTESATSPVTEVGSSLGVNADQPPGLINGSNSSPTPPPASYTPVTRLRY